MLWIVLVSIPLQSQTNLIDLNTAKQIVNIFLTDNAQKTVSIQKNINVLFSDDANVPNAYLFNIEPIGFVIISSTNKLSPIIAYSLENNFAKINSIERNITLGMLKEIVFNDTIKVSKFKEKTKDVVYGPYVYNMWGQVNCINDEGQLVNVSNIYTPNNYAPGCVTISQVSIMRYYNWPPRGMGAHAYTDNSGSSTGYYAANYSDSQYDWAIMLDRYRAKESTIAQRRPVGDVVFDVAISLFMDFEAYGSTSNVNRIPTSLANYFRFTSLYKDASASGFWSLLDSNMAYKQPVVLAINGTPGGHSVVCDGLNIEDGNYLYHLNMGWWGVSNGWYAIRSSFNAGSYTTIDGATMNIIPEPYVITPEYFSDSSNTIIHWMYPENVQAEAFELQVSIDGSDWQTISNNITDTYYSLVPNIDKNYKYRVRAKTNGFWYSNSWSNIAYLRMHYTSINENSTANIKIFPVPFSNQLMINLDEKFNLEQVEVYDIFGRKIYSNYILGSNMNLTINSCNWKKGVYIVKVKYNNQVYSVKTIKN